MKSVFLAVVLHGSILGVFVLFLLWNAGKFDHGDMVSAVVQQTGAVSVGWLPVVPVLRPLDPVRAALADDLATGRAVCVLEVSMRGL